MDLEGLYAMPGFVPGHYNTEDRFFSNVASKL